MDNYFDTQNPGSNSNNLNINAGLQNGNHNDLASYN